MSAIIVIALMFASIFAVAAPSVKAAYTNVTGQPGVIAQASTTAPISAGYVSLGPLPTGTTQPASSFVQAAYIAVEPQVIGVGQAALIEAWCTPGMYHAFYDQGYTVNIIKPDHTTETLGPVNSYQGDDTYWWSYVPDQVGTWQFQLVSPGTYLAAGNYTDDPTGQGFGGPANNQYLLGAPVWYEPANSIWYNVTVQQNLVAAWPPAAIPGAGDYWSRPISVMNREWKSIAGNFPFSGIEYFDNGNTFYEGFPSAHYIPYVQAPTSAHVVWMKQNALSGLIGGWAGQYSVFSSPGTPTIIYDGRCYQTITKPMPVLVNGSQVMQATSCWECYDLQTGQIYWDETGIPNPPTNVIYELGTAQPIPGAEANNGYTIALATIVAGTAPTASNPSGGPARLLEYNPLTGAVTVNTTLANGMTTNIIYADPYVMSIQQVGTGASAQWWLLNWTLSGYASTTVFSTKLLNNVTWTPFEQLYANYSVDYTGYDFGKGIGVFGGWNNPPGPQWCIGYSLGAASMITGQVLFFEQSNDTLTLNVQAGASTSLITNNNGLVAMNAAQGHWNCWDDQTGKLVWTSQSMIDTYPWTTNTPGYPWAEFQAYSESSIPINDSFSELVACTYAGLYAINWADGSLLWHYYDNNTVPFESPYGGNSFFTSCEQAGGLIYSYAGEHTPSEPINRGWDTICLNATTGALVWNIEDTMVPGAVSDGYLCAANQDDGFMYVFGAGKTATTVTAPQTSITQGTSIMIGGTVLDESPAQAGTPCVADSSMSNQMEYLHMQQPINGLWQNFNMTGVPVVLTATDSSGTVTNIGTAISNPYDGTFGLSWTPPSAGTYHISAAFYGDDSYGSSSAGTNVVVSTAAAATSTPIATPVPSNLATNSDLMTYIVIAAVAIIIAIAIATILILRKH